MELYWYQKKAKADVLQAWAHGAQNVCLQSGTGSGKTVICSDIISERTDPVMAVAHRMEIVGQLSLTLARYGIRHNIFSPPGVIRGIIASHMYELGKSYYDSQSQNTVAGINTLIRMDSPLFKRVKLLMQDEGHHVLVDNTWGKAAAKFPNALGLYPTATPYRADGKGLGRHADGIFDVLVKGIPESQLINEGYLCRYRIVSPPSNLDLSKVPISNSGDYSPPKLRDAVHESQIHGDIVDTYLKFARGKLGITFTVDIKAAIEVAEQYRAAGVPAEVITGKTPDLLRTQIMRRFQNREIHQIVNVMVLGEGVHVKGVEVVTLADPTYSLAKFRQQVGRVLAISPGKESAIIIDHVNNWLRHGLPDAPRDWSLDRRERRSREAPTDAVPLRRCLNEKCLTIYERLFDVCPQCGLKYSRPAGTGGRSQPEQVDGDLIELDPDVLARLRGEIKRIDAPPRLPHNVDNYIQRSILKKFDRRQKAQQILRSKIALFAGYYRDQSYTDSQIYKRFYFSYGIDIATAQTLGTTEAMELTDKINNFLTTKGVIENAGT